MAYGFSDYVLDSTCTGYPARGLSRLAGAVEFLPVI